MRRKFVRAIVRSFVLDRVPRDRPGAARDASQRSAACLGKARPSPRWANGRRWRHGRGAASVHDGDRPGVRRGSGASRPTCGIGEGVARRGGFKPGEAHRVLPRPTGGGEAVGTGDRGADQDQCSAAETATRTWQRAPDVTPSPLGRGGRAGWTNRWRAVGGASPVQIMPPGGPVGGAVPPPYPGTRWRNSPAGDLLRGPSMGPPTGWKLAASPTTFPCITVSAGAPRPGRGCDRGGGS